MKKFVSIALTLLFVLSLSVTSFAANEGSITINGISADTSYAIYQLLDLESYNKGSGAYSYKVNSDWTAYFETDEAKAYLTVDEAGYVTWTNGESDAVVAEFAQKALSYAKANNIKPVASSDNGDMAVTDTKGVFSGLALGWYLVDSTAGALCGLTTTDPDASINAKNHTPTIDKQVQEDLTGMWGDTNTADIGQVVNFMTIIHVAAGAENYVLHDSMSEGLTFEHDLDEGRGVTEIKHVNSAGVETVLAAEQDYTVKTAEFGDECDFEVIFSDEFIASLKPNDRLLVYYNAMLNRYAEIGTEEGNTNQSRLEYGEDKYTTYDKTTTYTFSIDIVKTDSTNKLIDGAEFRIYDSAEGGNEIKVVPLMESDDQTPVLDDDGNPIYRRAREDEEGVAIKVKDGKVTVIGFDNGIYYLEETIAPTGYNKLTSRKEFTIADGNLDSIFNDGIYSTGSGVHVVNKTGSMLPETGARGTIIFICIGVFAVLATGVVLVTRKRMSMIKD
ncbi:MAG: isopeptide-forming domain-containing fimbrial protein [Ruminococcaceae bacterium]|nr:isopeptide-forming domain-containing fimbrial protein [Oscillospiraceae bacterium]